MCKKTFSFSNRHFSCCFSSKVFFPLALFIFIFIIIICPRFLLVLSLSLSVSSFAVFFVSFENTFCYLLSQKICIVNFMTSELPPTIIETVVYFFLCRSQCAVRFCNGRFARVDGICFMSTFYHHLRFCAICYCYFSAQFTMNVLCHCLILRQAIAFVSYLRLTAEH